MYVRQLPHRLGGGPRLLRLRRLGGACEGLEEEPPAGAGVCGGWLVGW